MNNPGHASDVCNVKVSRIVRQQPVEFIRLRTWTATPARFENGVSAVTSLCLVDEPSAGGQFNVALLDAANALKSHVICEKLFSVS